MKLFSAVRLIFTLKCEQSTQIVSESLDRELTTVERWAIRLHYIGCWSCRRFGKQVRQLREVLRFHPDKTTDEHQLSAEAVSRIEEAIHREAT